MSKYAYSVKATKYGTPTGSNTMPGTLTALPDNVKGSITMDKADATITSIYAEQKKAPIRRIVTADGDVSFKMQFHDISYDVLEAMLGGTAVAAVAGVSAAAWQNGADFEILNLAMQVELDSGQYFNFYNAMVTGKVAGNGNRDGYFYLEISINPQLAADNSGDWEIRDVTIPSA